MLAGRDGRGRRPSPCRRRRRRRRAGGPSRSGPPGDARPQVACAAGPAGARAGRPPGSSAPRAPGSSTPVDRREEHRCSARGAAAPASMPARPLVVAPLRRSRTWPRPCGRSLSRFAQSMRSSSPEPGVFTSRITTAPGSRLLRRGCAPRSRPPPPSPRRGGGSTKGKAAGCASGSPPVRHTSRVGKRAQLGHHVVLVAPLVPRRRRRRCRTRRSAAGSRSGAGSAEGRPARVPSPWIEKKISLTVSIANALRAYGAVRAARVSSRPPPLASGATLPVLPLTRRDEMTALASARPNGLPCSPPAPCSPRPAWPWPSRLPKRRLKPRNPRPRPPPRSRPRSSRRSRSPPRSARRTSRRSRSR